MPPSPGYGTIGGTGGFTNNGVLTQGAGILTLANTSANYNNGSIQLALGRQFQLTTGSLNNRGTLALNGASISGGGSLINSGSGTMTGPGLISAPLQNNGVILPGDGLLNISAPWSNAGIVHLGGPASSLNGGTVTNTGTIQGIGNIGAAVTNASGTLEAIGGGTLNLTGALQNQTGGTIVASAGNKVLAASGLSANAGLISLTGGTFDNGNRPLNNTGQISGFGTFRTGGAGLVNSGSITFTGGVTTITGNVTNAAGHQIHAAYDSVLFTGNFVNNGVFKNTEASVTFAGSYTENGTYISDPADNHFQNLSVGEKGALVGGRGDRFIISGSLVTTSQEEDRWETSLSELRFNGGDGSHMLGVTGSDAGYSDAGFSRNFAWGILSLGAGDRLTLTDADAAGGALYVNILNLEGGVGQIGSIESGGLNVYYDPRSAENSYLGGRSYDLSGGGRLAPVPEPSGLLLLAGGAWFVASRRRRARA